MMERGWMKYASIAAVAALSILGVLRLLKPRKPRSFREDPIGAIKDHSEIIAGKAHDTTEELFTRIQDSLNEVKGRLPEIDSRTVSKQRKQLEKKLTALNDQAQALVKETRKTGLFSR